MSSEQPPPAGWYDDPTMANTRRYWDGQKWTEHRQEKPQQAEPIQTSSEQSTFIKIATRVLIGAAVLVAIWLFVGNGWDTITNAGTVVDPTELATNIQNTYSHKGVTIASIECDDPGKVHDGDITYCRGKLKGGVPFNLRVTFKHDGSYRTEPM